MDAGSRHLLEVMVTTVIFLIPTAKCLEVWRIFSGNQNFGRTLQNVAGPVQIHSFFSFLRTPVSHYIYTTQVLTERNQWVFILKVFIF